MGSEGTALSWIRAFLGNRSQTVVLEGEESGSVPVTSGVPQGSVMRPIMFLVYINDLPEELSSQVRLFADDTAVYLTAGGSDDGTVLQTDLDRLSVWESQWDMEFNPSKCQVVRVTTAKEVHCNKYSVHFTWSDPGGCHKCKVLGGGHLQRPNLELPHRQNYWKHKSNFMIHPEKHQNKKPEGERNSLQYACPPSAGVFCPDSS